MLTVLNRCLVLVIALAVVAVLPVGADTKIVRKTVSSGASMMGKGGSEKLDTTWFSKNKFAQDDGQSGMILNMDDKKMYMIDHGSKTFNVLSLPIDFKTLVSPEMAPMLEGMMSQMKMDVTITPTDETKEISGYSTTKYLMEVGMPMGKMSQELWVTKEFEFDLEDYKKMALEMASVQPMFREAVEKMMQIDGFPVVSETTMMMMGQESKQRQELVSAEEATPPAGTYAPPEGYTEQPFDVMNNTMGR